MTNNIPPQIRNSAGIYQIRNIVNNKCYVGSTNNFANRIRSHRCDLRRGRHGNERLHNAYRKYGMENFEFNVLQEVSKLPAESSGEFEKRLLELEYKWMTELKASSRDWGYNIRIDPASNFGITLNHYREDVLPETPPNHQYGSGNHLAVINEEIAKEIKILLNLGIPNVVITRYFGLKDGVVAGVKAGGWSRVVVTLSDIESYVLPDLPSTLHRNYLDKFQVKKVKFLLAKGYSPATVSRFLGIKFDSVKVINAGKFYTSTEVTESDLIELEADISLKNIATFLRDELAQKSAHLKSTTRRGSNSHTSKLCEEDVMKIKGLLKGGLKRKVIAKQYNVSPDTIYLIERGKTWTHV